MDIFQPIVPPVQYHPNFAESIKPHCAGVRKVLQGWADGFIDRDGKFVHEFQTTYNSSFWELYLHAVLRHLGIAVDFSKHAPDFVCPHNGIAIEATIASHAHDAIPEWEKTIKGLIDTDLEKSREKALVRLSNAFHSKATKFTKDYSVFPHVKGHSFIVAISNYGTPDFGWLGDVPMQRLLYDVEEEKEVFKENGSPVPLGLFRSNNFEEISAVIYSSVATFGKARALSDDAGDLFFHAVRIRNNLELIKVVASKANYKESLCDGLRLFINPFAKNPIGLSLFGDPGIRKFDAFQNGNFFASCHDDGDLCMRMVYHN